MLVFAHRGNDAPTVAQELLGHGMPESTRCPDNACDFHIRVLRQSILDLLLVVLAEYSSVFMDRTLVPYSSEDRRPVRPK